MACQEKCRENKEQDREAMEHVVDMLGFGHSRKSKEVFLILPNFPQSNLRNSTMIQRLSGQEQTQLVFQGLGAIQFLHRYGVGHYDIKPDNFLVASRQPLHIVLADFGTSGNPITQKGIMGGRFWAPPEAYKFRDSKGLSREFNTLYDIWSFGMVILYHSEAGLPRVQKKKLHKKPNGNSNERPLPIWPDRNLDEKIKKEPPEPEPEYHDLVKEHAQSVRGIDWRLEVVAGSMVVGVEVRLAAKQCIERCRALQPRASGHGHLPN